MRALIERTPALQGLPLFLFAERQASIQGDDVLAYPWPGAASEEQPAA